MNINEKRILDGRYTLQQATLNKLCTELGLVAFRPNYHAKTNDSNTVLIYRQADEAFNLTLEPWDWKKAKDPVFVFENTDANGKFDLNFAKRGSIDLKPLDIESVLKKVLKAAIKK